jgi:uncharacterized protein (DUF1778 family)
MPDETGGLEAQDAWEWAAAEKREGRSDTAVTVSIRLSSREFEAVAECAEREGATVTDFIRTAALDAARERSSAP